MESIYIPALERSSDRINIPLEEVRHLRALRQREGARIYAVNGGGLAAEIEIDSMSKNGPAMARVIRFIENMGEPRRKMGIAFGILADREKNELIVEKAVELGFSEIIPVVASRSQKRELNLPRLELKIISAMKQCLRSVAPKLSNPVKLSDIDVTNIYDHRILADIDGTPPYSPGQGSAIVFVGPEGGFDESEVAAIKSLDNSVEWRLGPTRQRAETASIVSMGILASFGDD